MTRLVTSRYRDAGDTLAQTLIGALGGTIAVPFYYNRTYNLNYIQPSPGQFIQWADAIRGYAGTPPVIPAGTAFAQPTAGTTNGVVSPGNSVCACGTTLSTSFRPPVGSVMGGITSPGAQTIWMVGAIAAGQSANYGGIWRLTSQDNTDIIELGINSSGFYQVSYCPGGIPGANPAVSTISADGTVRLIVVTLVTGNNHGIQVPTHGALVQNSTGQTSGSETTRTTQPYALTLFPGDANPGINSMAANVIEVGALTRSPTAADLTLLENNAVTYGATL